MKLMNEMASEENRVIVEEEAKGYFNLYFMLLLDHISYFHFLSLASITICHHRRSFRVG